MNARMNARDVADFMVFENRKSLLHQGVPMDARARAFLIAAVLFCAAGWGIAIGVVWAVVR